eukprot:10705291-Heterocapsa_arctica.AAC.1
MKDGHRDCALSLPFLATTEQKTKDNSDPWPFSRMSVRKIKVRQWAIKLNDGRFTSPETLVWGIAARGELAKIRG